MNYEFNLLHHVGVVAKRVCAAATAAHEGDDNIPLGPKGRGVKITCTLFLTSIFEFLRQQKNMKFMHGRHFEFPYNLEKIPCTSPYRGECDGKF